MDQMQRIMGRLESERRLVNNGCDAYVNWVESDGAKAREILKVDDIRDDELVCQFSAAPEHWKMSEWEALSLCTHLNRANVYSKKWMEHHCKLEFAEVETGRYDIFCGNHPEL